jgi:hypothetical protein
VTAGRTPVIARPHFASISIATAPPQPSAGSFRVRFVNSLLPGAGLIHQGRTLLGVTLGLAFWLPLAVAAYVSWIDPKLLATWIVLGLTGFAVAAYVIGQALVVNMANRSAVRLAEYLAGTVPPLVAAYEAMAAGQLLAAQLSLDTLLAFDREHFEGNLLQARLLVAQQKFDKARAAYARCRRLDPAGRWRWEVSRELAALGNLPPGKVS